MQSLEVRRTCFPQVLAFFKEKLKQFLKIAHPLTSKGIKVKSRDGSTSNGYALSNDYLEDIFLAEMIKGSCVSDAIAKDIGEIIFELNRIQTESKAAFLRTRRFIMTYSESLLRTNSEDKFYKFIENLDNIIVCNECKNKIKTLLEELQS